MKGPKELKRYVQKHYKMLRVYHWDDLVLFKLDKCKKWRKKHRMPRDGSQNKYTIKEIE